MSGFPLLSLVIFLPLVAAAFLFALKESAARIVALAATVATFLLALPLWTGFDSSSSSAPAPMMISDITRCP